MALGIHIGGCSCVCDGPEPTTLWKLTLDGLDTEWWTYRGLVGSQLNLQAEYRSATNIAFDFGAAASADDGNGGAAWLDAVEPVEQWRYLTGAVEQFTLADDALWTLSGSIARRVSYADGTVLDSGTITAASPGLWGIPNSNNIIAFGGNAVAGTSAVRLYSNAYAELTDIIATSAAPAHAMTSRGQQITRIVSVYGGFGGDYSPTAGNVRLLDESVNALTTISAPRVAFGSTPGRVVSAGENYALVWLPEGLSPFLIEYKLKLLSLPTLATVWSLSVAQQWPGGQHVDPPVNYTFGAIDTSGNCYLLGTRPSGQNILYKRSAVNGAVLWATPIVSGVLSLLVAHLLYDESLDRVFLSGQLGDYGIQSHDGITGELVDQHHTGFDTALNKRAGTMAIRDGFVYVPTFAGSSEFQ